MLKKTLFAAMIGTAIAATSAMANINIVYQGLDGFLRSDDATGLLDPAASGNTALVQLIHSVDNVQDAAGIGGTTSGDDTVLEELVLTEGGTSTLYGEIPAQSYSDTFQAGFIYVRVFDQGTSAGGAGVVGGTWYYNGNTQATFDNNTPANPDAYNAQGGNPSVTFSGFGDFLNEQVVPEPATFALMGLGGLVLAIRRRLHV